MADLVWMSGFVCVYVVYVFTDILLCVFFVSCRKDERMRVLGEALYGIRVIKLFAWEDHFDKAISTSIYVLKHIHEHMKSTAHKTTHFLPFRL